MEWLLTGENVSTFIAVAGLCLFATAGALLGKVEGLAEVLMRLTIVIAIVVGSASLFAGCFPDGDSRKPLAAHSRQCEQQGFKQGTAEHADCRLELARQANPRAVIPASGD